MPPKTKSVTHIFWLLLALSFGIALSYVVVKGVVFAYDTFTPKQSDHSFTVNTHYPITQIAPQENVNKKGLIRIGFVGDIIPGMDASINMFDAVLPYTQNPDVMIGNFEGAISTNEYQKCGSDKKNCFAFNGDNEFLKLLSVASFDVLNVANNHFNDYGPIGQSETLREITNAQMTPSGIKNKITYLNRNNITIGIIGVSNYFYTFNMESTKTIASSIVEAKQKADIVVVVFHGGGEGVAYAHVPQETEWYLGENRGDLRTFTHSAVDAGADIVLGSGPHVLRAIENYNNKLIAYSMGNFASANSVSTFGILKTSAMLDVTLKKDGSFVNAMIYPFELDG